MFSNHVKGKPMSDALFPTCLRPVVTCIYYWPHYSYSVSQCLQQCEIKIKSNTICQKFVAIYFGSLAVQPRYILPILIKFGRCGLLSCSRMIQGLPLCQRKSLKNQMEVWSTYWRAKPLTPRQVLRRYNKQTYKIFVRTCPTIEPHHWMTTALLPPTCKFTYSCMTWTQLSSWNSLTCTFGTVHYLHADFWIWMHSYIIKKLYAQSPTIKFKHCL